MAMKSGSVVAVGQRMGGEEVALASDIHRKGMLEARVWAEEARLDSGQGQRRALRAVLEMLGEQGSMDCNELG